MLRQEFLSESLFIVREGVGVIFDFYYLWLPIFLMMIFWMLWKKYVVAEALLKTKTAVVQFRLPQEITKSPKAMELFLEHLHQTSGEGNLYKKYWKGGTRSWYSLELVSIGGEVRFYIWTRKKHVKEIENEIYAQYPSVEVITDAEDYTKKFNYDPETKDLYGTMFVLAKDDPYPIKTYIDFGLDADPKEEFKVDPIASTIEFLGSIQPHEQVWVQVLIRAHKKYEKKSTIEGIKKDVKKFFEKRKYKDWEEQGKVIVEGLKEKDIPDDPEELSRKTSRKTKYQEKVIEAIERSISKRSFDCAIRALYLTDKGKIDEGVKAGVNTSFKQYTSDALNYIKPESKKKQTNFDYPWQDITGKRMAIRKQEIFDRYIRRSHFETRYNLGDTGDFILNVEELATIYHFPSSGVETPTLPRILSKKAEPPTNLPL